MKNWNGYLVSEDGTLFNKDGSRKSAKVSDKGYLFSNFYVNGKLICKQFHTIVAEAYLGEKPEGYEVDHINNIRSDNRVSNLQYLTKSQNNKKSYASGNRNVFGNNNPNSLHRKQLRNVQRLSREGVGQASEWPLEMESLQTGG